MQGAPRIEFSKASGMYIPLGTQKVLTPAGYTGWQIRSMIAGSGRISALDLISQAKAKY